MTLGFKVAFRKTSLGEPCETCFDSHWQRLNRLELRLLPAQASFAVDHCWPHTLRCRRGLWGTHRVYERLEKRISISSDRESHERRIHTANQPGQRIAPMSHFPACPVWDSPRLYQKWWSKSREDRTELRASRLIWRGPRWGLFELARRFVRVSIEFCDMILRDSPVVNKPTSPSLVLRTWGYFGCRPGTLIECSNLVLLDVTRYRLPNQTCTVVSNLVAIKQPSLPWQRWWLSARRMLLNHN